MTRVELAEFPWSKSVVLRKIRKIAIAKSMRAFKILNCAQL